MHTSIRKLAVAMVLSCLPFSTVLANTADKEIVVTKAFAAESAPTQKMAAVYLDLSNKGTTNHSLISVVSGSAQEVQIHDTKVVEQQHQMRPINELEIQAGATKTLQPGGTHLMLVNIKQPLKVGEVVALTLMYEDGSKADIKVPVEKL